MYFKVFSDDYEENFGIVDPKKNLLSHLLDLQGVQFKIKAVKLKSRRKSFFYFSG